jgi:hypothetical protein
MARVSIKAVLFGFLATLALDILVGVTLLAVLGGDIAIEGKSEQQIGEAIRATSSTPVYLACSLVLGSLTTVVGGYVTARIAKSYPYFNGLALGVLGIIWGALFWSDLPLWLNLLGLVLAVPTALLGAHVFARRSRRQT